MEGTTNIPTIDENEHFIAITEKPGYYISNYKRIYNLNANHFVKEVDCVMNGFRTHLTNNILYNKYFNQPDEINLIAIIRYDKHKFENLYYDRTNDKFYKLNDDVYIEKEVKSRENNRTDKIINAIDVNSKSVKIGIKKLKKHYLN